MSEFQSVQNNPDDPSAAGLTPLKDTGYAVDPPEGTPIQSVENLHNHYLEFNVGDATEPATFGPFESLLSIQVRSGSISITPTFASRLDNAVLAIGRNDSEHPGQIAWEQYLENPDNDGVACAPLQPGDRIFVKGCEHQLSVANGETAQISVFHTGYNLYEVCEKIEGCHPCLRYPP